MGKAERDKCLKTRLDAIDVVRNIRKARRLLTGSKFDLELFNKMQGDDNGVDRLVGHSVMFEVLNESEKLSLRREINSKLFESEQMAFGHLREATLEYMTDLNKTIDGIKLDPTDAKVLTDLSSEKRKALNAFEASTLSAGTLDAERNLSALEHIEKIADRILDMTNGLTIILDEAETAEEEGQEDDESSTSEEGDTSDTENDEDIGNENEEENHDCDDGSSDEDTAGEKGEGSELPTSDDNDLADITWIEAEVNYFKAASPFMNMKQTTMKQAGFTPEKAKQILNMRESVNKKYMDALTKFKNVVSADTCTAESLMLGNKSFYDRYGKVIGLVTTMEHLRATVDKTCDDLVKASHAMMIAATKSEY